MLPRISWRLRQGMGVSLFPPFQYFCECFLYASAVCQNLSCCQTVNISSTYWKYVFFSVQERSSSSNRLLSKTKFWTPVFGCWPVRQCIIVATMYHLLVCHMWLLLLHERYWHITSTAKMDVGLKRLFVIISAGHGDLNCLSEPVFVPKLICCFDAFLHGQFVFRTFYLQLVVIVVNQIFAGKNSVVFRFFC